MFLTLLLFRQEEDEPEIGAPRDPRGSVGAAVQEGLWLLWQSCLAGLLLQVLEGGIPQGQAEADSRGLGAGRTVKNLLSSFRVAPPNSIPASHFLILFALGQVRPKFSNSTFPAGIKTFLSMQRWMFMTFQEVSKENLGRNKCNHGPTSQ